MDESKIIEKLVNKLNGIEGCQVCSFQDFTEERSNLIAIVGIDSVENVNFALPDWDVSVSITIDSFIEEDKEGLLINEAKNEILKIIKDLFLSPQNIQEVFEEIPVVGVLNLNTSNQIVDGSHRYLIKFNLIVSENE